MKKLLIIISLFMTCIFGFANAKPLDVDVTEGAKLPNFELRDFHGKYTKSKKIFGATKKYVEDSKFTFPVYYDATNTLMTAFKVKTVPYNLIIQNSRIQKDLGGSKNYEELKEAFYLNY